MWEKDGHFYTEGGFDQTNEGGETFVESKPSPKGEETFVESTTPPSPKGGETFVESKRPVLVLESRIRTYVGICSCMYQQE